VIDHRTVGLCAAKVARQAIVEFCIDKQRHLSIKQVRDICNRDFHRVHRKCNVPAVEVSAMEYQFVIGVNDWIVV